MENRETKQFKSCYSTSDFAVPMKVAAGLTVWLFKVVWAIIVNLFYKMEINSVEKS